MYLTIPYKGIDLDKINIKARRKKEKEYLNLSYSINDLLITDLCVQTPVMTCYKTLSSENTNTKNKYQIDFKCNDSEFINTLITLNNKVKDYYTGDQRFIDFSYIERDAFVLKFNVYKDIYTGFNIKSNGKKIDEIKENDQLKLTIAVNYVWINNYNFGVTWRIMGLEY